MADAEKRVQIGKRMRFEIFKRDGFRCMYCGATPPGALLHVDHIVPVATGGKNEPDNLVTSCQSCNIGKGAVPLSAIPKSMAEKAQEVEEREAQVLGYNAILQARSDRLTDESWEIAAILCCEDALQSYSRRNLASIRMFLDRLPFVEVEDAARIATSKGYGAGGGKWFRYFCGVCWRKIKEGTAHG